MRIEAFTLKAPGLESRRSVESALRQAGLKAGDVQMVEIQGPSSSAKTDELLQGARLEGTPTALGPLKDLGITGLAGLCGIGEHLQLKTAESRLTFFCAVWRLRGWVPGQNSQLHHCLQHTVNPNGQAATVILSRSDGQAAAAYGDVEHLRDGRERLGHNPAQEAREIGWRMEGLKSREGDRMPVAVAGQVQLTTRGGDRAALARL